MIKWGLEFVDHKKSHVSTRKGILYNQIFNSGLKVQHAA